MFIFYHLLFLLYLHFPSYAWRLNLGYAADIPWRILIKK